MVWISDKFKSFYIERVYLCLSFYCLYDFIEFLDLFEDFVLLYPCLDLFLNHSFYEIYLVLVVNEVLH